MNRTVHAHREKDRHTDRQTDRQKSMPIAERLRHDMNP